MGYDMQAGELSGPEEFVQELLDITLRNLFFEYYDRQGALEMMGHFLMDLPFGLGLWHAEAGYAQPHKDDPPTKKLEW